MARGGSRRWLEQRRPEETASCGRCSERRLGKTVRKGTCFFTGKRARSALRHLIDVDHVGMVVELDLLDVRGLPAAHFEFKRNHAGAGLKLALELRPQRVVGFGHEV